MKTVGLRELKNRLSFYVRRAADGERLTVTDRGQIIAELGPPQTGKSVASRLADMAHRGELRLAEPVSKEMRAPLYQKMPRAKIALTAIELLDLDRGER